MPVVDITITGGWAHPICDRLLRRLFVAVHRRSPELACRIWNLGHRYDARAGGRTLRSLHLRMTPHREDGHVTYMAEVG